MYHQVMLGYTGKCLDVLGYARMCKDVLGYARLYQDVLEYYVVIVIDDFDDNVDDNVVGYNRIRYVSGK